MTAVLAVIAFLWLLRAANVALSFALIPRLAPAPRREAGVPFVSIVVPARNEERDVGDATRSKCMQDDPSFEVVVVDDRSSDGTRRILAGLEREFPKVLSVVDGVEPPPDWLGKPHALDEGARAARARASSEWLIFSDADVHFAPDLLARAFTHAERERLDFLSLFPALEMKSFGERLMTPSDRERRVLLPARLADESFRGRAPSAGEQASSTSYDVTSSTGSAGTRP